MKFKNFIKNLCLFSCFKKSDTDKSKFNKLIDDDRWKSLIKENNDFESETISSSEIIEI